MDIAYICIPMQKDSFINNRNSYEKTFMCVVGNGWVSCAYAQMADSVIVKTKPKSLTQIQRDSLLMLMQRDVDVMSTTHYWEVGRYKVYRIENIYNSLKLDTMTGKVTALQIGINNDASRMEYTICGALSEAKVVGRYELYPTGNRYNFILLDTAMGYAYQVQWSTETNECGRWRIW